MFWFWGWLSKQALRMHFKTEARPWIRSRGYSRDDYRQGAHHRLDRPIDESWPE